MMCQRLWDDLGIEDVRLELNSLGSPDERGRHRAALIAYLEGHADQLDDDARRRLHSNPLRILDTKNPLMQSLIEAAPRLDEYLGEQTLAHFDGVKAYLKDAGIPFRLNHRLVRGLDYYNLTVFEWTTDRLGAQGTICAGGRYDGLVAQLGGKPSPACGFAIGMERLLLLWQECGGQTERPAPDLYVVHQGEAAQRLAFRVAESLRGNGFALTLHCGGGSFKSQMKKADASGAQAALIIGDDEVQANAVTLKLLRTADGQPGEQRRVGIDLLGEEIARTLYDLEDDDGGL